MKRKHINGYSIFEYWSKKDDLSGVPWILDHGEKECFMCGFLADEIKEGEKLKDFWNKPSKLEKAHIIPHSLGGVEEPFNMIFLCGQCHQEAPDTIDYDSNLKWVSDNRGFKNQSEIRSIISNLSDHEIKRVSEIPYETINRKLLNAIGTHGIIISKSSAIIGLEHVLKELLMNEKPKKKVS